MEIDARFDYPLEAALETDVTSKSNSFIGPGVTFRVSNNNLFRGGEVLSVKLNGSYEWQTGNKNSGGRSSRLNSYELGLNANLDIPRLLLPRSMTRRQKYPGSTSFQLGVDLMNRPSFFRLIAFSGSAGYNFQTSPYSRHSLTVFKLTYNKLLHTTDSFDRTMDENPAIAMSFRNQFVPSINYTYTFERTYGATGNRRFYWQNSVTSAGNLLSGILRAFGERQPQHLFGNRFSQFVKEVSEVKFYHRIGRRNNWLATRFLVGAGYAYGNSEVMPYSEQFYIGGANSIRAFTIRSLGPGSYRPPADDRNGYLDQTGDFKLEANVEYRFGIMGRLNGAVFLDAGNIWLLKKDPKRPGAELKWKGLLNDIALGTGFRTALRHQLPGHPRRPRHRAAHPPIRIRTRRATTTFPVSRTVSDSTWPSGIRSKRPLRSGQTRQGKAERPADLPAPTYPRQPSPGAPPSGIHIRPFDPFRPAGMPAVTSRSPKSLSPSPAASASLPHLRHVPLSPDNRPFRINLPHTGICIQFRCPNRYNHKEIIHGRRRGFTTKIRHFCLI